MDFIKQGILGVLSSGAVSVLLNHLIQVYCFTYSILCLLTAILTLTNFIYADYLLKIKPIGIASFLLFYSMKLWTSFDSWMVWINCLIAMYIAVYFYDACCNIAESIDTKKQTTTRNGAVLVLVNIILLILWIALKKSTLQNSQKIGIFGQKDNYIYLAIVLIYFGINLFRMQTRSLFPVLISVLIVTVTLVLRQILRKYSFTQNLPLEALVYLAFVIDAEGREYINVQNKIFHHFFLTAIYFYGFVITNEPNFHVEYFLLGVGVFMMLLNK